jgi:deoxycytidylate deaminase
MDTNLIAVAEAVQALDLAQRSRSEFLLIGIVGAVGSGNSWTGQVLERLLAQRGIRSKTIKARTVLRKARPAPWEAAEALARTKPFDAAAQFQSIGDELRQRHDHAFVASGFIAEIEAMRAAGCPPVVICDSLRHPDEVRLLRMVYGEAFWLLGVVCDQHTRRTRLLKKLSQHGSVPSPEEIARFIERDQDSGLKHGQKVAATFEHADYFVDTSPTLRDPTGPDTDIDAWPVTAELGRFFDLIQGTRPMLRPTDAEQAMYHAYAARLGSACLSRQVGAALVDRDGQLLATGCNEVPRAGGGLYGQGEDHPAERERGRCFSLRGFCSNTRHRNGIIDEVMRLFEEEKVVLPAEGPGREAIRDRLRRSSIGQLIEFSRSVHAEMDALMSAARKGISTVGARLFVTTFPCHNCARHIVAAGIDEVYFIEPYLKSKALLLHDDAVTQSAEGWEPPSMARRRGAMGPHRVLFRPYTGAAPRLAHRAFVKDGEVKDSKGNHQPGVLPRMLTALPIEQGLVALEQRIAARFHAVLSGAV